MTRILKIEFLKLIQYKPAWLYLGLFSLVFFLTATLITKITTLINADAQMFDLSTIVTIPQAWKTYSWLASWFHILLGLFLILITTNEFVYRTLRQHIIDGMSRKDVFASKLSIILGLALYPCLLVILFCLFFGKSSPTSHFFDGVEMLFPLFFKTVNYLGFAMILSLWLKKPTPAIIWYLLYPNFFEPLLGLMAEAYADIKLTPFLPFQVYGEIIPSPLAQFMESSNVLTTIEVYGLSSFYVLGILIINWLLIEKSDF